MIYLTNEYKRFKGLGSDRVIFFNSNLNRFVLLKQPSQKEILQSIEDYNIIRITSFWNDLFLESKGKKQACLRGFTHYDCNGKGLLYLNVKNVNFQLTRKYNTESISDFSKLSIKKQKELLEKLRPKSFQQAQIIFQPDILKNNVLSADLLGYLKKKKTPVEFLDYLCGVLIRNTKSKESEKARISEYLCYLHGKGWLLFTLGLFNRQEGRGHRLLPSMRKEVYSNRQLINLQSEIEKSTFPIGVRKCKYFSSVTIGIPMLLRVCNVQSIGDFSDGLLAEFENIIEKRMYIKHEKDEVRKSVVKNAMVGVRRISESIIRLWEIKYQSKNFPPYRPEMRKHAVPDETRRTDGTYKWALDKNPKLNKWVEEFIEYGKQKKTSRIVSTVITPFNDWLDYLMSLTNPPLSPQDVNRHIHVVNVADNTKKTFWLHLENMSRRWDGQPIQAHSKNKKIGILRDFFDWYHDKLLSNNPDKDPDIKNPIKTSDHWSYRLYGGKTHRTSLGVYLLNLLKSIIVENDFAWPKTLRADYVNVFDRDDSTIKRVWWPGRAILMHKLLTIPLRSFQGRWLDSGEGDEEIFDFDKMQFVPNTDFRAQKGRKQGILRLVHDPINSKEFIGLYINSNKTRIYDDPLSAGYEIPWCPDELLNMLKLQLNWLKRYGSPCAKPVTFADDPKADIRPSEAVAGKLPPIYPLFRDPKKHHRNIPLSTDRLNEFYVSLLGEAEKRLRGKGKNITLVHRKRTGKRNELVETARFDLHTLRVSGITALADMGVPFKILSEFVAGHATLLQTLYYYKPSPDQIRAVMQTASEAIKSKKNEADISLLEKNIDDFKPYLLANTDYNLDEAFSTLKDNIGIWQVDLAGICPGTSCEIGGPQDDRGRPSPVPGGRCCPRCRFWITGPAFLIGQTIESNNLLHRIIKKGNTLSELRIKLLKLEVDASAGDETEMQGRIERLERDLTNMLAEWVSRYKFAIASGKILKDYEGKRIEIGGGGKGNYPLSLLTSNTTEGLEVAIKQTHYFVLLDHITQAAEFFTGFENGEAILEKEQILNKLLMDNGYEPFILKLSKEDALKASNILSSTLLQYVGEDGVESLIQGETKINKLPGVDRVVQKLLLISEQSRFNNFDRELIKIKKQ
jgi:hypothetical protein